MGCIASGSISKRGRIGQDSVRKFDALFDMFRFVCVLDACDVFFVRSVCSVCYIYSLWESVVTVYLIKEW